jgi:hypothetical protein
MNYGIGKPSLETESQYPTLEIIDLARESEKGVVTTGVTVLNQRGELMLSGWHKYLLKAA